MKVYGHLPGYLHRWCVVAAGRFMVGGQRYFAPRATISSSPPT